MADQGRVFSVADMIIALNRAFHKQFSQGPPWKDGVPGMLRASILVAYKFYVRAAFWQVPCDRRTAQDDAGRAVRRGKRSAPLESRSESVTCRIGRYAARRQFLIPRWLRTAPASPPRVARPSCSDSNAGRRWSWCPPAARSPLGRWCAG